MNLKFYFITLFIILLFNNRLSAQIDPRTYLKENRFGEVSIAKGIKFATVVNYKGLSQDLLCDIYQPVGDISKNRPCIVWIHGGGFRSDSKRTQNYVVTYATDFAKRGFVCISIDYRLRDGADMPTKAEEFPALKDAARDANTVLDWIRANAYSYNINPSYLFVAGGSAGGRIAITVAQFIGPDVSATTSPENNYKNKVWNKKGIIAAGILWGGLENEFRNWTYPFLNTKSIPAILIHGEQDKTISVQNSIDLATAMTIAKVNNELHIIPELGHTPTGTKTNPLIENWLGNFFVNEWIKTLSCQK